MAEPTDDLGMTSLDERVDAYLEGQLSRAEARRLEAELTEPAAAQALAEALALRELLAAPSGDDAVPDGLVARIEARLGVDEHTALLLRPRREREKAARRPRFAAVKNALGGFAWSWRGATMAAAPTSPAGDGLRTLSYAAAPLAVAARPITERAPAPKRALWKRVLGLGEEAMMVVGDVVLALLTAVGALVLVVLLVPISARARGVARETELALEAVVAWGFGVLAYRWQARQGGSFHVLGIRVWRSGAETAEAKRARREKAAARKAARAEKRAAKGKEKKGGKRRSPGRLWRSRRALWRALLRVLGALHVRGRVEGVVGLADPDDTMWIGLALGELEARLPEGVLAVDVDYTDEVLDLAGRLRSTVWPIEAVVVLLAVWARAEVRRALRAA